MLVPWIRVYTSPRRLEDLKTCTLILVEDTGIDVAIYTVWYEKQTYDTKLDYSCGERATTLLP